MPCLHMMCVCDRCHISFKYCKFKTNLSRYGLLYCGLDIVSCTFFSTAFAVLAVLFFIVGITQMPMEGFIGLTSDE